MSNDQPTPRIPNIIPPPASQPPPAPPSTPVKVSLAKPSPPKEPEAPPPVTPPKAPILPPQIRRLNPREVAFRVLALFLVIASLFLVWFSYAQLLVPRQQESRELSTAISRLSTEIDAMERQWTGAQLEQVTNSFNAIPSHLISDQPELEDWLEKLNRQVVPLALDAKADFGKTVVRKSTEDKLAVIPTTISVEAQPAPNIEGAESPYQRILRLTQRLASEQRRADITELTVTGGPESVAHAQVILNLWAGEEKSQ